MEIKERAIGARDAMTRKRLEHKLSSAREENAELSHEKKALQEQARHDHDELDTILDALKGVALNGKRHRFRRLTAIAVAAGGAYVMGAKAGRERFDQISGWWSARANGKRAKERLSEASSTEQGSELT